MTLGHWQFIQLGEARGGKVGCARQPDASMVKGDSLEKPTELRARTRVQYYAYCTSRHCIMHIQFYDMSVQIK
jgi:hypothetical protein